MNKAGSLTIRELPKTKKTAVDEMNPVQRIQKNVLSPSPSASLSTRKRNCRR